MKSNINFIFHAHLPFVRHPEYPKFLEEDWLFEAINESYLPLLRMMYKLREQKIPFRLVFSLSPTLCFMLTDDTLKQRFIDYMNSRIELGNKEIERLTNDRDQKKLAQMYLDNINENLNFYYKICNTNILSAFNSLSNSGNLELITTSATHAFLPVYKNNPVAVNAQVETGVMNHEKIFDKDSQGFWLPECGYYPGLEEILKRHNIKWTSLSSQAFFLASKKPEKGTYTPVKCPNGLYCFARDYNLTSLVWSSSVGYPADKDYREFYRDIGYDLPIDYIRPYIQEPDIRIFTGFKYWSITGKTADKVLYCPEKASLKTLEHAKDFLNHVKTKTESVYPLINDSPIYTLSFDAELFGHWWFEGIQWLENIIKLIAEDKDIRLLTPSEYIAENHAVQTLVPAYSSWGEGGYSRVWVDNSSNAWISKYTTKTAKCMVELAQRFPNQVSLKGRFITQAARECLLSMSSDWPFIIHNHTSEEYAKKRIVGHLQNFFLVYDNMTKNAVNTEWLVKSEKRNNIFPDLDYNIFNPNHMNEPSPVYTTDFTKKN